MKKRAWKRAVSAVLAAGMVLACTMASALAAEPDSVQEFRQGKTKMISAVNGGLLAVQDDGSLWGWGRADEGLLGNGGSYDDAHGYRTYPEKLMTDVAFVDGGDTGDITLAIKTDGSLWYTGNVVRTTIYGMMVKEWEYQTTFQKLTDHVVSAAEGVASEWMESAIYVVKDNGELWQYKFVPVLDYGEGGFDQSGNAIDGAYHFEIKGAKFMDDVEKVVADDHVLALKKDGSVWAWGNNSRGEIGNGAHESGLDGYVTKPVKVLENAKDIAIDVWISAAIKRDGSLWVWGSCPEGATESGFSTKPIKILDSVKDVSLDLNEFVALLPDDSIQALGGYPYAADAFISNNDSSIKDIEVSLQVLFALKEDGSLWAIGNNLNSTFGMEGVGMENGEKIEDIMTPVQLTGIEKTGSNENSTQTTPQTAAPTTSKVLVNGNAVSFDAYQINGNNYFKLRDVAKVISGTDKQFEVTWDGAKNAINLISGQSYTPVGGELAAGSGANQQAVLNTSTVYLDGKQINLTAYTIQGNNYFKLRDLGQIFDFGVGWDGANNTVTIDTSTGYIPE